MSDCKYFPCVLCNTLYGVKEDYCGFCGRYESKNTFKEATVKLCEESQMTLRQWFEIWKKEYLDEVIPQLDAISELNDKVTYDNPLYESKTIIELDKVIEILEKTE